MRVQVRDWRFRLAVGRVRGLMAAVLLVAVLGGVSGAQDNKPTVVSEAPPKPEAPTDKKVALLSRAIHLADFVGMKPREELKGQLTEIDDFVQNSPSDGQPATQKTVAYLGYTSGTLYVAFMCFDTNPGLIRGHLARREMKLCSSSERMR